MLSRFLINWPYKLAALVIAIALRVYVVHVNDPHATKQLSIPVSLVSQRAGIVASTTTPAAEVQVSGPVSALDVINASSYTATVDLRGAPLGAEALPIDVAPAVGVPQDVTVESVSPRTAMVDLEQQMHARLTIHVAYHRAEAPGFSYSAPMATPLTALVQGPASAVARVARLVAHADDVFGSGSVSAGILDGYATVEAEDAQGNDVPGVTVTPQQVEVRVLVSRADATRNLIVTPTIVGSPQYPDQIVGVRTVPDRFPVSGPPDVLARVAVVDTSAVNVSGAGGDVTRTVGLDLPPAVTPANGRIPAVVVSVQIAPRDGIAPAAAAAQVAP